MKLLRVLSAATFLLLGATLARAEVGSTHVGLSGPLVYSDGEIMYGASVDFYHEVEPNFNLGLETGYYFRSIDSMTFSFIPILPSVLYHVPFDGVSGFFPIIGIGAGFAIMSSAYSVENKSSIKFMTLAHLGAAFGAAKMLFVDIKFGFLGSDFLLMPAIGVRF